MEMFGKILAINFVIVLIFMSAAFAIAYYRKRLDTVDIAWGLGFVTVAFSTVWQKPAITTLVIYFLVAIWGLRLANHIWQRAKVTSEDPRYEEIGRKWKGNYWQRAYVSIFLVQGALILLVSLPVVAASGEQLSGYGWLLGLGVLVWLKGFTIESIADWQLRKFLATKNHPKHLMTGLWRYSRHPNYYGELLQWWSIAVIALQCSWGWIGLIGPLTLTILIVFISGIPPIEKRRQNDAQYQAYKQRTSALVLLPSRK